MSGRIASEGVLVRRKGTALYECNFVTLVASSLALKAWLAVGDRISLITETKSVIYPFLLFLDWGILMVELKKTKGAVVIQNRMGREDAIPYCWSRLDFPCEYSCGIQAVPN